MLLASHGWKPRGAAETLQCLDTPPADNDPGRRTSYPTPSLGSSWGGGQEGQNEE